MDETKFRWAGSTYACRVLGKGTEGRTRVEALEHGPRFAVGTELELKPDEIILPFDTSTPPIPPNDPQALQKAMDEERTTLPPIAEVLADPNPTPPLSASSQAAAPGKSIEELLASGPLVETEPLAPDDPRNRPLPWPSQTGDKMTETMGTPFAEKMKSVATGATDIMTKMIARADAFNAKKKELEARTDAVFAKHEKVLADGHAGLDMVEDGLRLLSNGGPA